MKIVLDTDRLTVSQLYALSWMIFEHPKIRKAVIAEHDRRDAQERAVARAQFVANNPEAFDD